MESPIKVVGTMQSSSEIYKDSTMKSSDKRATKNQTSEDNGRNGLTTSAGKGLSNHEVMRFSPDEEQEE
jgi:hypothetical protein